MELPLALRTAIEQKAAEIPSESLQQSARKLSEQYRNETGRGKRIVCTVSDATAYAVVRLPATYSAVCAAAQAALSGTDIRLQTVLDIGAGLGTAVWAFSACFDTIKRFVCVEREPAMIGLGQALMTEAPFGQHVEWIHADIRSFHTDERFDCVIASYALGELTQADRQAMIQALWQFAGKLLVLVEPGTPAAYAQLQDARKTLIALGAQVLAPCPSSAECPLPDGDWCHFTCRIARSRLHKRLKGGEAPYEDEKFAYLVMGRKAAERSQKRILRHPQIESGQVTLRLCTIDGIETIRITAKQKERFKKARKAKCGDVFE